jgi:hypothetical protein
VAKGISWPLEVRRSLKEGIRKHTLNRELGAVFKRWYPDIAVEALAEAANPSISMLSKNGASPPILRRVSSPAPSEGCEGPGRRAHCSGSQEGQRQSISSRDSHFPRPGAQNGIVFAPSASMAGRSPGKVTVR